MLTRINIHLISLMLLALATKGPAEDIIHSGLSFSSDKHWLMGAIAYHEDSPYLGVSDETNPIPYIAFETENLHLGIDEASYDFELVAHNEIGLILSLVADPRYGLSDPDDSSALPTLDRDFAIEAGLRVKLELGPFYLQSTVLTDVTSEHDGSSLELSLGIEIPIGNGELDISAGLAAYDEKLSAYLYGVTDEESSGKLTAYNPGDAPLIAFDATYLHPLTDSSALVLGASLDLLSDEARASPRIEDDHQASLLVGILWSF